MCQDLSCQNNEFKNLLVAIEDLRKELNSKVLQARCLLDPEVIKVSWKLDALLNKFYILALDSGCE